MWKSKKPKQPYTVAVDFNFEAPKDLDLTKLIFYSCHEDGSRGWAVCADDATPLTLTEAENIVKELGGIVLVLKDCQEYLAEYWQERLKESTLAN